MVDILTIYVVVALLFVVFLAKFFQNIKYLKREEKIPLIVLTSSFGAFILCSFISDFSKDYIISLTYTRVVTLAPAWFAYGIYLVSRIYPVSIRRYENKKLDKLLLLLNILTSIVLLIFIASPMVIETFEITETTPYFTYGPLYYLAAILSIGNVCLSVFRWIQNLKYCINHQKKQIKYTIIAVIISTSILAAAFLLLPAVGLSKYTGFSFVGLFLLIYYLMNSVLIPDELIDLGTLIKDFGFIFIASVIVQLILLPVINIPSSAIVFLLVVIFFSMFLMTRIDEKLRHSGRLMELDRLSLILTNIVDQKEVFAEVKQRLTSYFKPESIKIIEKKELPVEILKLFITTDVITYENIIRMFPQMNREVFTYMNSYPSFFIEAWEYVIIVYNSSETLTHKLSEKLQTFASDLNLALQRSVYRYSYSELSKEFDSKVERKTKDLQAVNNKLIESDKKKSEFLSIASHQLRTPIATLIGYTESLKLGDFGQYPANLSPIISSINQSAMYLGELVNDFLNVTKVEEGKLVIARTRFEILKLVEECYLEIKDRVQEKNLKFLTNFDISQNLFANLDMLKTKQCIMNLLDNAVKYTQRGYIKYESFIQNEEWTIIISDTGIGITEEYKKRMFEKFSRAPEASRIVPDGSGIGLYLVKSIVDLQGGNLSVESEVDKGTTFTVRFQIS